MALGWLQIDANLRTHRKSVHLGALVGDRRAWTYLVELWSWATQNEPSGLIRGAASRLVIEQVAGWTGESGALVDALIEARWLDEQDDGLYLHDWCEWQGAHIAKAEKDAERNRAKRAKVRNRFGSSPRPSDDQRTSIGRPTDGPVDVAGNKNTNTNKNTSSTKKRESEREPQAAPAPVAPLELLPPSRDPVVELQEAWNTMAGKHALPRWAETNKARRTAALARLRERPIDGETGWRAVIERIAGSPFCVGANDRGWRANPDWMLKPNTAQKLLEGQYAGGGTGPPRDLRRGRVGAEDTAHAIPEAGELNWS